MITDFVNLWHNFMCAMKKHVHKIYKIYLKNLFKNVIFFYYITEFKDFCETLREYLHIFL